MGRKDKRRKRRETGKEGENGEDTRGERGEGDADSGTWNISFIQVLGFSAAGLCGAPALTLGAPGCSPTMISLMWLIRKIRNSWASWGSIGQEGQDIMSILGIRRGIGPRQHLLHVVVKFNFLLSQPRNKLLGCDCAHLQCFILCVQCTVYSVQCAGCNNNLSFLCNNRVEEVCQAGEERLFGSLVLGLVLQHLQKSRVHSVFNRPGVAGAVLQTPLCLIKSVVLFLLIFKTSELLNH